MNTDTDLYTSRLLIIHAYWRKNLNRQVMDTRDKKLKYHQIPYTDEFHASYKTQLKLNFIKPMCTPYGACYHTKIKHTSMTFHFWSSGHIIRRFKRGGSYGHQLPDEIYANIASFEVLIVDDSLTLEEFKKKFDPRFITEKELELTWKNRSPQHGGEYKRTDFKTMSERGKFYFNRFLERFHSVTIPTENYEKGHYPSTSTKDTLRESYSPYNDKGRTIGISHTYPNPFILYVTEDTRGGREKCYIVANKNEVLHLEDD